MKTVVVADVQALIAENTHLHETLDTIRGIVERWSGFVTLRNDTPEGAEPSLWLQVVNSILEEVGDEIGNDEAFEWTDGELRDLEVAIKKTERELAGESVL